MKTYIFPPVKGTLITSFFLLFSIFTSIKVTAQITAGDFAIVGFNGNSSTVNMAIVALAAIPTGTVLKITDRGWDQSAFVANGSDGLITWTLTSSIPAGTLFNIAITGGASPTATGLGSYGTAAATGWTTGTVVAGGGDNWFLYTGTDISPNFIFGFANWSTALPGTNAPDPVTGWQAAGTVSAAVSYLPTSLSSGNFYITLTIAGTPPTGYHGDFNNYAGTVSGTKTSLLAAIHTKSNWVTTEILANKKSLDPGAAAFPGTNPIFKLGTLLPLNLLSFTGKPSPDGIALQWTTANEVNTAGFDIERALRGEEFNTLAAVSSNASGVYSFIDKTASSGVPYMYRLKMRDNDGKFTYSSVIWVTNNASEHITGYSIYPNPATGSSLYLKPATRLLNNAQIEIAILDLTGRTWYTGTRTTANLSNDRFEISIKQLPAGAYMLRISDRNGLRLQSTKFTVLN